MLLKRCRTIAQKENDLDCFIVSYCPCSFVSSPLYSLFAYSMRNDVINFISPVDTAMLAKVLFYTFSNTRRRIPSLQSYHNFVMGERSHRLRHLCFTNAKTLHSHEKQCVIMFKKCYSGASFVNA